MPFIVQNYAVHQGTDRQTQTDRQTDKDRNRERQTDRQCVFVCPRERESVCVVVGVVVVVIRPQRRPDADKHSHQYRTSSEGSEDNPGTQKKTKKIC